MTWISDNILNTSTIKFRNLYWLCIVYATYLDAFDGSVMLFTISIMGNAWSTARKMNSNVTKNNTFILKSFIFCVFK